MQAGVISREFTWNGVKIPDPGHHLSPEEVRAVLQCAERNRWTPRLAAGGLSFGLYTDVCSPLSVTPEERKPLAVESNAGYCAARPTLTCSDFLDNGDFHWEIAVDQPSDDSITVDIEDRRIFRVSRIPESLVVNTIGEEFVKVTLLDETENRRVQSHEGGQVMRVQIAIESEWDWKFSWFPQTSPKLQPHALTADRDSIVVEVSKRFAFVGAQSLKNRRGSIVKKMIIFRYGEQRLRDLTGVSCTR